MSGNPAQCRRPGERGRMITRGMSSHATARRGFVEQENRVRGSTRLERANFLKVLAFKKQRGAACGIESRAGQHGRAMDVRTNAFMRGAHSGKIERHTFLYVPNPPSAIRDPQFFI